MEKGPKELQRFTDAFAKASDEFGLELNISKTKCMKINEYDTRHLEIKIVEKIAEEVTSFTYLGYEVTSDGNDERAIKTRIALGWTTINKKLYLLRSKVLFMKNKSNLVETYIYPIVRYDLEAASWSKVLTSKIEVFQNDIMRVLTGNSWLDMVGIDMLKEKTKLKNLFEQIKSDKQSLFYKTKISERGVSKLCLEGLVEGKRTHGRPRCRWTNDIKEWTGSNTI